MRRSGWILLVAGTWLGCPRAGVVDAGSLAGPGAGLPSDAGAPGRFARRHHPSALVTELTDAGLGLVFTSEQSGSPQLHRRWADEELALTAGPPHHLQTVALRSREAVATVIDGEAEQLIAISLDDAGRRTLSPRLEKAHGAALSRDERQLAFEATLRGPGDVALVDFTRPSTPRAVGLPGEATGVFEPRFISGAESLLVTSSATGDPEVYRLPLDGGTPLRLTSFHLEDFGAVASADGRRIAFVSNREGVDRVFVQGVDGRGVVRLMLEARADGEREADPTWMPDGRSVLVTVTSTDGTQRLARVDVATRKTLWRSTGPRDQLPAPSPDGRYIAFVSDRAGSVDVYVMRADGTAATRLTDDAAPEYLPRWFTAP